MKSTGVIKDALRFLIAGGLNTGLSYLVFLVALMVVNYQWAYAISWIFGLLLVVIFYPSKVFVGSNNSRQKQLLVVIQYLLVFAAGLGFLSLLVDYLAINAAIAAIVTMGFTMGLNFLLMRLLYRNKLFS